MLRLLHARFDFLAVGQRVGNLERTGEKSGEQVHHVAVGGGGHEVLREHARRQLQAHLRCDVVLERESRLWRTLAE